MRPIKIELRGIDCISWVVYWYFHYNSQLELPENSPPNINVPLANPGLQVVTVTINSRFQALPVNSGLNTDLADLFSRSHRTFLGLKAPAQTGC